MKANPKSHCVRCYTLVTAVCKDCGGHTACYVCGAVECQCSKTATKHEKKT